MEKINDKKIYLAFVFSALAIAIFTGGISLYSRLIVEPEAAKLISSPGTMKQGYLMLREPQLFAGYRYWDSDGTAVKNTIRYFDYVIYNDNEIKPEERIYLDLLLKRRESGSQLGLKTAVFMIILSALGAAAFFMEGREKKLE